VVTVNELPAPVVPEITKQPQHGIVSMDANHTLSVAASVNDGGILSYQWYYWIPGTPDNKKIEGATGSSYKVPTGTVGEVYYHAVATNTKNSKTVEATSFMAIVKVVDGGDHFNSNINYGFFIDERETPSKIYRTVEIGTQTWMAENLNYATKAGTLGVCYGNADSNCDKYGRLYTWGETTGACPVGWHLPDNAEWEELIGHVDDRGEAWAATPLKAVGSWPNGSSLKDKFGFSAIPSGYLKDDTFDKAGENCVMWSSTESGGEAHYRQIFDAYTDIYDRSTIDNFGFSVRCVKD
jgi:uncharacterized protein (TIGR02145 family)